MSDAQVIQQFNEEKIAGRMSEKAKERLIQVNTPEHLLEEDVNIVLEFTKIAVTLVKSELAELVDEKTARNLIILFVKCLTQAIVKCDQHNITEDLKITALQGLALDVYNLCKDYSLEALAKGNAPEHEEALELARQNVRKSTLQRLKHHIEQSRNPQPE